MTSRTGVLVAASLLLLVAIVAGQQLCRMDPRFFGVSPEAFRALGSYLAGDYAGAARSYRAHLRREMLRESTTSATAWTALASGDLETAEYRARLEAAAEALDPEPVLTLAEVALARRDQSAALELAGRALALRRDDYDALLVTAVARARQGQPDAAIDALKRALRYDRAERRPTTFLAVLEVTGELGDRPQGERPTCLLAHLYRYLRIYDPSQARAAVRYAERAIEMRDRPDDAHVTIAILHQRQGHPARALAAFDQAIAVNPRNTAALLGAGRHRQHRGELTEAYRLVRAAYEADPADPFVAWSYHRLTVEKLGDYRRALTIAEQVVARNERDAEAWWRLGHVLAYIGDVRRTVQSYQHAVALSPRTPELQANLGESLAEIGRRDEAEIAFQRAIAFDRWLPRPHLGLGTLYGRARRWDEAIAEYEQAVWLGADLPIGLCEMYWETGRRPQASGCVTAVLTRDPENLQAQALMEHVLGAARTAKAAR